MSVEWKIRVDVVRATLHDIMNELTLCLLCTTGLGNSRNVFQLGFSLPGHLTCERLLTMAAIVRSVEDVDIHTLIAPGSGAC